MSEDINKLPENTDELIKIQKELKEEKETLEKMVFTIEKQLHALQIERMHMMNLLHKNNLNSKAIKSQFQKEEDSENFSNENLGIQTKLHNPDESNLDIDLNLSIPSVYKYYDAEDDSNGEEDDCDDFI